MKIFGRSELTPRINPLSVSDVILRSRGTSIFVPAQYYANGHLKVKSRPTKSKGKFLPAKY